MSFLSTLLTIFTFLFFSRISHATYSSSSRSNVALYWGQGAGQQRLLHYCQQATVDIIPIGFVHVFPAQGNGFPGTNFGNQCQGPPAVYKGPGPNPNLDQLQSHCPELIADVPECQSKYGKKIILSLGGGTNTYQLTGTTEGVAFADFLWGAFGPQTQNWLAKGLPRPFDGPGNAAVEVDGFDFDIELPSTDNSAGYIAMIQRLRSLFSSASKPYLITGAPQCIVIDANMGQMIAAVQFDIIFIQYFNTPQCSARSWVSSNPNYLSTGVEQASGFTYDKWAASLVGTASANAKLYIGLLANVAGNYYLNPSELSGIAKAYFCKPNFGGIMLWEATSAESNADGPYYSTVKNILAGYASDTSLSCYGAPPKASSVVTLSTSTRKTTSSTAGQISSTILKSSSSNYITTTIVKTSTSTKSTFVTVTKTNTISGLKPSSSVKTVSTVKPSSTTKPLSSIKSTSTPRPSSSTKRPTSTKSLTSTLRPSTTTKAKAVKQPKKTPTPTPAKSTTKTSASPSPSVKIPDGACGAPYGNSCGAGNCCSKFGYCGTEVQWCGDGCQKAFGVCW